MTLPNFLLIGAAKSGTTSLASYLSQHPEVFIPPNYKEPNFFILEGRKLPPFKGSAPQSLLYDKIYRYSVTDFNSYQNLFQSASTEKAIGEASIPYLYYPHAPLKIKSYIPDVKLIAILRNPVDRLYSHYLMVREKYLLEPLSLTQALEQEKSRIEDNWGWDWHYATMGMYYNQLKRYFELFDKNQLKLFLYDDYCQNPIGMIQEIYRYIGVDDSFIPDISKRSKKSIKSRSLLVSRYLNSPYRYYLKKLLPQALYKRLISSISDWNSMPIPSLSCEERVRLKAYFKADIMALQNLINRDLSAWL